MAAIARSVAIALLFAALQTLGAHGSVSLAFSGIDTNLEIGTDTVGTNAENEIGELATSGSTLEVLATTEAQTTNLLLAELRSAETAMKHVAMNITTPKALEILGSHHEAPPLIRALVKQQGGQQQPGYAGVQKGQDMLNEMIKEAMEKLDLERQTCYTFIKVQSHQIWVTVQNIRMYDARSAKAREEILAAQTEIQRLTSLLPKLTATLKEHMRKCEFDISDLEAQLKIVSGDIEVMSSVLKLTECKASLLMVHAGKMHSKLLRSGVDEACEEGDSDAIPAELPSWSPSGGREALVQLSANPTELEPTKQRAKCTLSKKSCKRLRDKFLDIQAGIEAKRDELQAEILSLRKHCEDEKANLEAQISDAETDLKVWQTALAKATKAQNDAERNSKLKNEERIALIKELVRMIKLCKVNINNYVSEGCALGKIRGELEKMKGHTNPAFLQDCEVTDWAAEECSASCNGGTQKLSRAVSVHPVGGSECPPLEMSRPCNEDRCPVDCEMEDWSEWGDCSAECNGGVKQKIRNILSVPEHGGEPCGESSVAESCNLQSCDVDCILGDWAGWSLCSKQCDSGLRTRTKGVTQREQGDGSCPRHDNDLRLEFMPCNEQECKGAIVCTSMLDVVLLLDGSGSLLQAGWDQTLKFAEMFIKSLQGGENTGVKLSVILFSGPTEWSIAQRCTGVAKGATPSMEECGIQIVQHFTSDLDAALVVVKGMKWPAASTLTSQALMAAASELGLGRRDASSVVVVVTDGRPMNAARTLQASKDLRKSARLMFVPVTANVPMADMKTWVSKPVSQNLIQIESFWAMTDPETVNQIISDMCPDLNQTDCWRMTDCPTGMTRGSGEAASVCSDSTGKACDLGYCAGKPAVGIESCSTGPKSKEQLFGVNLGHNCWNRFPCPTGMIRTPGDGSVCEDPGSDKRCDLGYCNAANAISMMNLDMERCTTGSAVPTTTPAP